MRLKKQLSGGRVPHLLWGQGTAGAALSGGHQGAGPSPGHPEHPLLVPIPPRGSPPPLRAPGEERGWVRPGPQPTPQLLTSRGGCDPACSRSRGHPRRTTGCNSCGEQRDRLGGPAAGQHRPRGGHHALGAHREPWGRSRNTQLPALPHTAPGWQHGWSRARSHRQLRACRERGAWVGNGSQGHGHPTAPTQAGPRASSCAPRPLHATTRLLPWGVMAPLLGDGGGAGHTATTLCWKGGCAAPGEAGLPGAHAGRKGGNPQRSGCWPAALSPPKWPKAPGWPQQRHHPWGTTTQQQPAGPS